VVEVRLMVKCDQAPAGARVIRNGSNVMVYCHHVRGRAGGGREVIATYPYRWSPAVEREVLGWCGVCMRTKDRALQSWQEIIFRVHQPPPELRGSLSTEESAGVRAEA